jgi:hypothetical protein
VPGLLEVFTDVPFFAGPHQPADVDLARPSRAPRKGAVSQWETVPPGKGRSSR